MRPDEPSDSGNPFPGLRPFREDEEHLFFGREAQVDHLVDKLGATRFLAVVGSSGSGKSSLVSCGLIPALHRGLLGSAGSGWRVATMRPGNRPIRALAEALAQPGVLRQPDAAETGFSAVELVEATLRMSKLGLIDAFEEALPDPGRPNLLVVVDQFEELFRYRQLAATAAEEAVAFVKLLLEVAAQPNWPVYVALSMRSDFLGECAQFNGLPEAINRGQYLVPRMSREERRAAIAGPLQVCRAGIEAVLLTRLVNDVGDNPDQLSILQHALNRTWACWRGEGGQGPLALRHYEAVGTMAHALNQHAEEAWAELAPGRPQALCEALFKAITDKGTDARGTRRPTRLDTLTAICGATAEELSAVMAVFRHPSRAFLMPPAGAALQADTPVDISHESLMRVWARLRRWGDEEAQSAQTYRRLAETAELYPKRAGLLGPPELQVALDWRERVRPSVAWAERYRPGLDAALAFLTASDEAWNAAQAETARRRESEAQQKAQYERARLSRRWLAAVGVVGLTGAGAVLALYVRKERDARQAALVAQDQRDAARAAQQQAEQARQEAERALLEIRRLQTEQQVQKQALRDATQNTPGLRARYEQAVATRTVVYLQYADDGQDAAAARLRSRLESAGYSAPRAEKVDAVPSRNELRYFRSGDASEAQRLADRLLQWDTAPVVLKLIPDTSTRSSTLRWFELWLARPHDPELQRLVLNLNASEKGLRLAAGQALQSRYTGSSAAIASVLDLFDLTDAAALSVEGRINALYFLSRTAPSAWTPALELRGRDVVVRLESGDPLGSQTRAELNRLRMLLDGLRSNPGAGKSGAKGKL